MKTNRLVGIAALFVLTMCRSLTTIDVEQDGSTTVPGNPLAAALGSFSFTGFNNMNVSQSQSLQNQGVTPAEINSAKLRTLQMTITSPSGGNFSFLKSITIYAESGSLPKLAIASGSNFGAVTTINLDVQDAELAPYVTASSMSLTTDATGTSPSSDTTIAAVVHFDIDVNLKGAICGK